MRTRVKFCGITRPEDAQEAIRLGVDAIGLVFVQRSPRCVSVARAREICAALPPLFPVVGLFMDAPAAEVREISGAVALNWLQFHGSEEPEYCASFDLPFIKALPMASPGRVDSGRWAGAGALLLDAHAAGEQGGSGKTFDWDTLKPPEGKWILAGGLNPDNIAEARASLAPPAVDVSSGIESAPGIKSASLMRRFMENLQHG